MDFCSTSTFFLVTGRFVIYLWVKSGLDGVLACTGYIDNMILYRNKIPILIVIADLEKIYKDNTN